MDFFEFHRSGLLLRSFLLSLSRGTIQKGDAARPFNADPTVPQLLKSGLYAIQNGFLSSGRL